MADIIAFSPHQPELYRLKPVVIHDREHLQIKDILVEQAPPRHPHSKLYYLQAWLPNSRLTVWLTTIIGLQGTFSIAMMIAIYISYGRMFDKAQTIGHTGLGPDVNTLALGQLITVTIESIYLMILCLDATRTRNVVEAIGVCLNSLSMLITVAVGMWAASDAESLTRNALPLEIRKQGEECLRRIYIPLLCMLAISTLGASFVAWRLSYEFAWAIHRHIADADLKLRKRYLLYEHTYIALLHLDFFFLLGFWVSSCLISVPGGPLGNVYVRFSIAGLAFTPVHLLVGLLAASHESRMGQYLTLVTTGVNLALVGFGLCIDYWFSMTPGLGRTAAYGGIAILLLIATSVLAIKCMMNFGKGVRHILRRKRVLPTRTGAKHLKESVFGIGPEGPVQLEPLRRRMDLD